MSKNEVNKVHKKAQLDKQAQFDLTMKGEAENAGVIKVNAAEGEAISDQSKSESKKTKEFSDLVLLIESLQGELGNILDDIKGKMDEYRESRDRQKRMSNSIENGDFESLRLIFINEYYMDANEVNGMNNQELIDEAQRRDQGELDTQAVLRAEIRELAQEYKNRAAELGEERPALAEAELQKLDGLKYQAAALGLDFDKLLKDEATGYGSADLLAANRDVEIAAELNETFNKVAPDIASPFEEPQNDQELGLFDQKQSGPSMFN